MSDQDSDSDGVVDCKDTCPSDANKIKPGQCGCGVADTDSDGDGTADCNDQCPKDPTRIDDCDGPGVTDATPTATPTPMPTAAPNLLNAPRVKASRGSVLIWVVQKLSRKDRVSFSITGPRNRTVRGRRQLSANKKTTRIWVNLSKLPKGTYQARWEVLWSGGSRQIGLPKTFRIK